MLGPPPATTIVLAVTEQQDIASFTFLTPTSIVLAATETSDVAAFSIVDNIGAVLAATERRDIASFQFAPFGFPPLQSPGLGWSVHRRPTFDTIVAPHASGSEVRVRAVGHPVWEFELTFDGLAGDLTSYPSLGINSCQALLGMAARRSAARRTASSTPTHFDTLIRRDSPRDGRPRLPMVTHRRRNRAIPERPASPRSPSPRRRSVPDGLAVDGPT